MNELKEFSRLRPDDEPLDPTTSAQVWEAIVGDRVGAEVSSQRSTPEDADHEIQVISLGRVEPQQRRRVALLGAAAAIAIGMAGFVLVQNNRTDPPAPAIQPAELPESPTTTAFLTQQELVPAGPLDYATTINALPMWPETNASEPPATTTAYGMFLCDGGPGTKIVRVDPASGPAHAYSGTLCVFTDLTDARPDAITSCATTTGGFNYARCQRRTNETDTAGAGTSIGAVATADQQTWMAAFPTATASNQAEEFAGNVAAAARTEGSSDFGDDRVSVTLSAADNDAASTVDLPGVCFQIDLPGATAGGCAGRYLLATGLAYGAFQDGDGPIDIVGIVPDEVTAIEINGTTVNPINNIWHYTADPGDPLRITARSADGRTATTN